MDPIIEGKKLAKEVDEITGNVLKDTSKFKNIYFPFYVGFSLISSGIKALAKWGLYKELMNVIKLINELEREINDVDFPA